MEKKDGYIILESSYTSTPEIISDKCDITIFKTVLQEAELPNRNKRIYSRKALEEALARPMVTEKVINKTFYGEAGHPREETLQRQTYIDQRNISHIITNLSWEGNLLVATIETANTAAGKDFQGLIRQGSKVSFSMRGVGGSLRKKDGYDFIDTGLHILTYDWVVFPSHEKAYMKDIIKENTDFFIENNMNSEKVLTEGYILSFDEEEINGIMNEGFFSKLKGDNLEKKEKDLADKFKSLRPRLLEMVANCKTVKEIDTLVTDLGLAITELTKKIEKNPELAKPYKEHIAWCKGEYTKALIKKKKELSSIKKEEFTFNESHVSPIEMYTSDSYQSAIDSFMKTL